MSHEQVLNWLRSAPAIRQRCGLIYAAAQADALVHFCLHENQLDATADYVLATMRHNYPDLNIPYHSRWRHLAPHWNNLQATLDQECDELVRIQIELAIISVLLDAGAGTEWRYHDPVSHQVLQRSEGLAIASLNAYQQGLFSADPKSKYRVDGQALADLQIEDLQQLFQVNAHNPILGLSGRLQLLHSLASLLQRQPEIFGQQARLGCFYDYLQTQTNASEPLTAAQLLHTVLDIFSPIWPGRLTLAGHNLGDVWQHTLARCDDASHLLIPFHKLSQWLSYSLLEPLAAAGIHVQALDQLTGLPEYRNGGLFIDLGVLTLRNPKVLTHAHEVESELIVEWRALTVILLDQIAKRIRDRLELSCDQMPLAKILQGGTWSAGRRIAQQKRPDGSPPLRIISDGTVF